MVAPWIAAAAPAAAGAFVGAAGSLFGGKSANKAAKKAAREQMRFQEYMSNTAHQREVADLKAAGLNPILSANTGASSPSGAMADIQMFDVGEAALRGASVATEVQNKASQRKLIQAQIDASVASARAADAQAKQTNWQTNVLGPKSIEEIDARISASNVSSARNAAETNMINARTATESLIQSLKRLDIEYRPWESGAKLGRSVLDIFTGARDVLKPRRPIRIGSRKRGGS